MFRTILDGFNVNEYTDNKNITHIKENYDSLFSRWLCESSEYNTKIEFTEEQNIKADNPSRNITCLSHNLHNKKFAHYNA